MTDETTKGPTTFTRYLPVALTEEAWAAKAKQLADLHSEIDAAKFKREEVEAAKKAALKKCDAEIETLDTQASDLARVVRARTEDRNVACMEVPATTGEERIHVVRMDTKEVIQTRAMSGAEREAHRQTDLFRLQAKREDLVKAHGEEWVAAMEASVKEAESKGLSDAEIAPAPEESTTLPKTCATCDGLLSETEMEDAILQADGAYRHRECPTEIPDGAPQDDGDDLFGDMTPVDMDDDERRLGLVEEFGKLKREERVETFTRLLPGVTFPQNKKKAVQMMADAAIAQTKSADAQAEVE